jgi:tyrosyl-tRNA synthetase
MTLHYSIFVEQGVKQAEIMTKLVFGSHYSDLKASDVISAFKSDPRLVITTIENITGMPVTKLASQHGLVSSNCGYSFNILNPTLTIYVLKAVARNLVASRGLYLNNRTIQDPQYKITPPDLLDTKFVILRAGKDKMLILLAGD